jgi:hypothetical protein
MIQERLQQLEDNEAYASYQAELAFEKELNILRNDFYYQMIDSSTLSLVDFMYKPLDTLSGDAYSARRIDNDNTFYLLVDGMGKGVSASLTTITMTAFVNHTIDKMLQTKSFNLDALIQESIEFIQPILLDDEVLAIDFICFNSVYHELEYAKFAMPPFLLQDFDDCVHKIKSNNLPLSKWTQDYNVDILNVQRVEKFLFYTDGIVENQLAQDSTKTYAKHIEEDFKNSFTKEEFREKLCSAIGKQEDDLALIFINSLDLREKNLISKKIFSSDIDLLEEANLWYEEVLQGMEVPLKIGVKAGLVFTELFMNAYEHGNLGIDSKQKHRYLEDDVYFEKLKELQKGNNKTIEVEVYKITEPYSTYIVTKICDEGEGFDTHILSQIFRNSKKFNGRGVFVSRKNSMGIYYNPKGNCVLFLNKIK